MAIAAALAVIVAGGKTARLGSLKHRLARLSGAAQHKNTVIG
ncbi:hypothetical protein [Kingella oralis]|nr:hypothetical protein [Kingella oralis]